MASEYLDQRCGVCKEMHPFRDPDGSLCIPQKHQLIIEQQLKEKVDHPSHYGGGDNIYEHIKVVDAWGLNYRTGNATKYIARTGFGGKGTDPIEDLKKALWYIQDEIKRLERDRDDIPL